MTSNQIGSSVTPDDSDDACEGLHFEAAGSGHAPIAELARGDVDPLCVTRPGEDLAEEGTVRDDNSQGSKTAQRARSHVRRILGGS